MFCLWFIFSDLWGIRSESVSYQPWKYSLSKMLHILVLTLTVEASFFCQHVRWLKLGIIKSHGVLHLSFDRHSLSPNGWTFLFYKHLPTIISPCPEEGFPACQLQDLQAGCWLLPRTKLLNQITIKIAVISYSVYFQPAFLAASRLIYSEKYNSD